MKPIYDGVRRVLGLRRDLFFVYPWSAPNPFSPKVFIVNQLYMSGYAWSRDYVRISQSPQKTPHGSTHPKEKQTPTLSLRVLCGLLITSNPSNSSQPAQNSQWEGWSHVFQWDESISVQGLLRRLRGPYVIPRPGLPRHISLMADLQ